MIQRIQTIYFLIAIACLCAITFGLTLYVYTGAEFSYQFSSYGIQKINKAKEMVALNAFPYYIAGIAFILIGLLAMISFKNLKRQLVLGRLFLGSYVLLILILASAYFFGSSLTGEKEVTCTVGIGFFVLIAGLPFIFLAISGIRKDKNLLDSLNRLR